MSKHPNEPGGDLDVIEQSRVTTIPHEDTDLKKQEIIAPGASLAVALTRTELDMAVSTAKAYPRSLTKVAHQITELSNMTEDVAEECMYALPRGGKTIKGPSIRFAEIVYNSYQNCQAGARVTHVDHDYVEAEGVFYDMENNVRSVVRVRRRILDKNGARFNTDMINTTSNACCAIAKRNAILSGVPKALWSGAFDKVFATIAGTVQTLDEKRTNALKRFQAMGVEPEKVFAMLGVRGEKDIKVDDIPTLRGVLAAIKNGEETVESVFSPARMAAGKDFKKVETTLSSSKPSGDAGKQKPDGEASDLGRKAASGDGPGESPAPISAPESADGWRPYIQAKTITFKDGDELNSWFNSKAEKDLRKRLGVPVDDVKVERDIIETLAKRLKNGETS